MEAEGPLHDQWPPSGHALLFGDLSLKPLGNRMEIHSDNPGADARRLMAGFLAAVYRRTVDAKEAIARWHMRLFNELFTNMKGVSEGGETLFDRTMFLYGSNLGNANTHVTTNLPVLFAGGGFQHGQHLAFDTQNNYPLPNLFVSMLQRFGIETDRFATSTGTMRGLNLA